MRKNFSRHQHAGVPNSNFKASSSSGALLRPEANGNGITATANGSGKPPKIKSKHIAKGQAN